MREEPKRREFFLAGPYGKLFVIEELPPLPESGKCQMAIICHGISASSQKPILAELAGDLLEAGIGVIRFDFNGLGKSGGRFEEMTIPKEIEELGAVFQWLEDCPHTAGISLAGHSQGGVVAAMKAGALGAMRVRCLCLLAPAAILRADALRGRTMDAVYDPWNVPETVLIPSKGLYLGREYIESVQHLPIYETAFNYTGPVFIMQGIRDRVVPYTCAEHFHAGYKQSEIRLIPDEDHSFTRQTSEAARLAADFFVATLA